MSIKDIFIPAEKFRLNTTADENGLPLGDCVDLLNVDLSQGGVGRRGGMQRLGRATDARLALDLNGTTQIITVPVNAVIHTLRKEWTVRAVVQPDTVAAARTVLGFLHATNFPIQIQFTATAKVEVKVTDSASAVTTMTGTTTLVGGTTYVVEVVRIGTALTVYLNGASEVTGTMADLDCIAPGGNMTFGRNNTGEFFDGKFDYCTAYSSSSPLRDEGMLRCTDPKAEHVLWDYWTEVFTLDRIEDGSRFENHGIVTNGTSTATALTVPTMRTNLMAPYVDEDYKARVAIISGNSVRLAEISK